jgi:phasin family protein
MMAFVPEQIEATRKAALDAFFGYANKTFEGVQKLVELNVQAAKSTIAESQEKMRSISVQPGAAATQAGAGLQPSIEKAMSYNRHVFEIVTTTQADCAKIAESQYEGAIQRMQSLFDSAAKNAPAGSETMIAALKSMISASNAAYETVQKTAKQAADFTQSNVAAASNAAWASAQSAPRAASESVIVKS